MSSPDMSHAGGFPTLSTRFLSRGSVWASGASHLVEKPGINLLPFQNYTGLYFRGGPKRPSSV